MARAHMDPSGQQPSNRALVHLIHDQAQGLVSMGRVGDGKWSLRIKFDLQ